MFFFLQYSDYLCFEDIGRCHVSNNPWITIEGISEKKVITIQVHFAI